MAKDGKGALWSQPLRNLCATFNDVEPLIVWLCHLYQVADAVIEAPNFLESAVFSEGVAG